MLHPFLYIRTTYGLVLLLGTIARTINERSSSYLPPCSDIMVFNQETIRSHHVVLVMIDDDLRTYL